MIPPAPPQPPATKRGSCAGSLLALSLLGLAASSLLILPTGPIGPVFVLGGLAFGGLFAFHYLVWGRWLGRLMKQDEDEANQESSR